jgi:SAM-dependent methyltransferase
MPGSAPRSTDDVTLLNLAAEAYFHNYPNISYLLNKPFSDPSALSRRLIELGVLIDGMRLMPGDTVLELGAGPCWVSHFLNKFGCRTISVDVSKTALAIGRSLFERDSTTRWDLEPTFVPYDGHTLPATDESIDAVVLYDSFHHLPNPEELLREMKRVLRCDGIVAMSEPGRDHAQSSPSRLESAQSGVLEDELAPEEITRMAHNCGFATARCIIATNSPPLEIDVDSFRALMGGWGVSRYWSELCASLDSHYFLLLFRGEPEPSTRKPKHLKAGIVEGSGAGSLRMKRGKGAKISLLVKNLGDTRWLAAADGRGWTRVGAHLYRNGQRWDLLDFDWTRASLPHDVHPGNGVEVALHLPPLMDSGKYVIAFDLVVEGLTWFADRESAALYLDCHVED